MPRVLYNREALICLYCRCRCRLVYHLFCV